MLHHGRLGHLKEENALWRRGVYTLRISRRPGGGGSCRVTAAKSTGSSAVGLDEGTASEKGEMMKKMSQRGT